MPYIADTHIPTQKLQEESVPERTENILREHHTELVYIIMDSFESWSQQS